MTNKPELVNIAENGDLVIWTAEKRFRIQSIILITASPVFKTMFEPGRYLEGSTRRSADEPYDLTVEDNSIGMELLCQILHFQCPKLPLATMKLRHLAEICDKYQCASSTRYHVLASLLTISPLPELSPENHKNILLASYVFDLPEQFSWAAEQVALDTASSCEALFPHIVIPSNVQEAIISRSQSLVQRLYTVFVRQFDTLVSGHTLGYAETKYCEYCAQCIRDCPKKCSVCGRTDAEQDKCHRRVRLIDMTSALKEMGLCRFQPDDSPRQILKRVRLCWTRERRDVHHCPRFGECPIWDYLSAFIEGIESCADDFCLFRLEDFKSLDN